MTARSTLIFAAGLALLIGLNGLVAEAKSGGKKSDSGSLTVTEDLLQTLNREGKLSDDSYRLLLSRHQEELKSDWTFKWKNGLRFERGDGLHKLKIAGHIQNDWTLIDYDAGTARSEGLDDEVFSGTQFRRARIAFSGRLYKRIGFRTQVDFSDGGADLKGVWVSIRKLGPLGALKIGQIREPFSLEGMTGSQYTTFMERALPNALVPKRGTGFQFSNAPLDGRITWRVSALRGETNDSGKGFSSDDAYDIGARVTGLPLYRNKGEYLVHLGASYIHQFRSGAETFQYRARPEAALARRVINTKALPTRGQDLFGFELAVVAGRVSIQTEFIGSVVNQRAGGEAFFWGAYGMATLSLTGEHREFDKDSATFDRLKPIHEFNPKKGHWGAWELAARFSLLDLDDGSLLSPADAFPDDPNASDVVGGGQLRDITAGINWHLYSNFRWMLNYVLSDKKGEGITNIGQMRFQLDF